MATRTTSTPSANGSAAEKTVARAKDAGESVATVARRSKGPAIAAGATVAGLAGGLALGARMGSGRRRILGLPVGRKKGFAHAAQTLGHVARGLASARKDSTLSSDEARQIREELGKRNRQSPVEVLLDGLTHRRGAHKGES